MLGRQHSSRHHHPAAPGSGGPSRLVSFLSGIRDGFFSIDLYGYTPSLIVSEYKTIISLFTSLLVISAFATAVAYTTYIWVMATLNQTEAEQVHDEAIAMLPPKLVAGAEMLPLPQFGLLLLLGNGTFVSWTDHADSFKLTFQQSVICNSDAGNKKQDIIPQESCSFADTSNVANPKVTRCAAWDAATTALTSLNNTASNFCNIAADASGSYSVPRVMGTFYNTEYSYITATVSMNSSLSGNAAFLNMVSKGSMQIFLSYNYTSPGNLAQGVVIPDLNQIWSRRMNLFPNMTVKAEVLLRSRVAAVHSYWWDVPSLQSDILDYSPSAVETYVSIPGSAAPGFTDIGKVFLHFDDKDTLMDLVPQNDALAIVSGWGGFLSILLAVGAPAVMINQMIFHNKVKKLISDDKITFDEDVREMRSEAVSKSYAAIGGKAVMSKPSIRSRRGSVLGLLPMRLRRNSSDPDKSNVLQPHPSAASNSSALRSSPPKSSSKHIAPDTSVSAKRQLRPSNNTDPGAAPGAAGTAPPKLMSGPHSGLDAGRPPRPASRPPSNQVYPTAALWSASSLPGHPDMDPEDAAAEAAAGRHALNSSGAAPLSDEDRQVAAEAAAANTTLPSAVPQASHLDNQELQQMASMLSGSGEQQHAGPQPVSESKELLGAEPPESAISAPNIGHQQVSNLHPAYDARRSMGASEQAGGQTADPSAHHRRLSVAMSPDCDCGFNPNASAHFDRISQFSAEAEPEPMADQQVASMAVKYDGDCFADDDEEENFEDVVRHATSECNALFHLRQVVKLVQQNSPVLTLWSDHLTQSKEPVLKRKHKNDRGDEGSLRKVGGAANVQPPAAPTEPQGWIPQAASGGDACPQGRRASPTRTVAALSSDAVKNLALEQQLPMATQGPALQDGHAGGLTSHLSRLQAEQAIEHHACSCHPSETVRTR